MTKQQRTWLQVGVGATLIVGVVVLATCLNQRPPELVHVTENMSKFLDAQDAAQRAHDVCSKCGDEVALHDGGVLPIDPCVLECLEAIEKLQKATDRFAGAVVDAGAK